MTSGRWFGTRLGTRLGQEAGLGQGRITGKWGTLQRHLRIAEGIVFFGEGRGHLQKMLQDVHFKSLVVGLNITRNKLRIIK